MSSVSHMPRTPFHIPGLTGVRAFAALWVVLLHFRANIGVHDVINYDWLAARGFWGVDFFFVLSGFILSHTYLDSLREAFKRYEFKPAFKVFLVKRFARIYPLHVVSLALFAGLLFLGQALGERFVSPERCTLVTLLPNLLMIHGWGVTDSLSWNYPSWSISAEWFAYLFVFAVFVRSLASKDIKAGVRLIVYSWLALCLYNGLNGGSVDDFTSFALPRVAVEFLGGCVLYRLAKDGFGRSLPRWSLLAGISGTLALSQLSSNFEFLLLPLICLILLTLYHGGGYGEGLIANPATVFLGEISYSIYLLHPFGQIIGDAILKDSARIFSMTDGWLILSAEIIGVILLAALVYYMVERPLRGLIVRWYAQRTKRQNRAHPSGNIAQETWRLTKSS